MPGQQRHWSSRERNTADGRVISPQFDQLINMFSRFNRSVPLEISHLSLCSAKSPCLKYMEWDSNPLPTQTWKGLWRQYAVSELFVGE
jgi:hypothetical protein